MTGEDFYAGLETGGLVYGPLYRRVRNVAWGDGVGWATLERPTGVPLDASIALMIEGGLQATGVLLQPATNGPTIPVGVGRLRVASSTEWTADLGPVYAAVSRRETTKRRTTFDVTLVDGTGQFLARIEAFSVQTIGTEESESPKLTYLRSRWQASSLSESPSAPTLRKNLLVLDNSGTWTVPLAEQVSGLHVICITAGDTFELRADGATVRPGEVGDLTQVLATFPPAAVMHRWAHDPAADAEGIRLGFETILLASQCLLRCGMDRPLPALVVLPRDAPPAWVALPALTKTIRLEQPSLRWKIVSGEVTVERAVAEIKTDGGEEEIEYREGARRGRVFEAFVPPAEYLRPIRAGMTWVVTGGAGAVGLVLAKYLRDTHAAKVVLWGRRKLDEIRLSGQSTLLDGAEVYYVSCDVTRSEDVHRALKETRAKAGEVHGVVHAAGLLNDGFVVKKDLISARRVLAPKIEGVKVLDEVLADEPLELMVLCSSVASVNGNVGQCDYAFANGFLDAFAQQREQRRRRGECRGRTLSIQWPLWQGDGMGLDTDVLALKDPHHRAINTATGIKIFETCLCASEPVLAVFPTAANERPLVDSVSLPLPPVESPASQVEDRLDETQVLDFLKSRFAELTRIPIDRIKGHEALERYGIDSLLVMSFTRRLEEDFGPLSKSLLFEHQTLDALASHFATRHAEKLKELCGMAAPALKPEATKSSHPAAAVGGPNTGELNSMAENMANDAIAIIGVSGRYPQAENLDEFWRNLENGRDCITEVPAARWNLETYFDERRGQVGKTYNRWGGFLAGVDQFDAGFFRIPPREAEVMDPQERLFLETAWHAVEEAGYARAELRDRAIGVFVGVMFSQYQLLGLERSEVGRLLPVNSSYASIANRVSYWFDWHGPSLAVDTMCSSSLSALHLACDSLHKGEAELALAGGVNLSLHPLKDVGLAQGGFAASDGRCKSFGARGDGYVPGEGVGAVLLKPLAQALADGDHLHGIIRSTAVNHGGKTNGYTVPNPKAQTAAVSSALVKAGIASQSISYVEAHGTGTALGDPIEIAALTEVFGMDRETPCAIGSVKSNVGHLEAAAGMAGLSKLLLQLRHRQLVPSLHSDELNPNIEFTDTPFVVQREMAKWSTVAGAPRRAGLSSFGAGGSNAHVIVEEFLESRAVATGGADAEGRYLLVFSAVNRERLRGVVRAYRHWLKITPDPARPELSAVAFTLQNGREAFDERLAFSARDWVEMEQHLIAFESDAATGDFTTGSARAVRLGGMTLVEGETGRHFVETLVEARDWAALGRWWAEGAEVPWLTLWPEGARRRVSLPGYVFAPERHWLPNVPRVGTQSIPSQRLHPLVTSNISTLNGVCFSSRFSSHEVLFSDHVVGGRRLLPGAATLELTRFVASMAAESGAVEIRDWVWLRPVAMKAEDTLELITAVEEKTEGRWTVTVCQKDGETVGSGVARATKLDAEEKLDLVSIRTRCGEVRSRAAFYDEFAQGGIAYGDGYRVVEELVYSSTEVLAKLVLPDRWMEEGYLWHPALLDGALQSLAPLALGTGKVGLPFAVQRISGSLGWPSQGWVHGRIAGAEGTVRCYDLTVSADDGTVLLQIEQLATRAPTDTAKLKGEVFALRPEWLEVPETGSAQLAVGRVLVLDEETALSEAWRATGVDVWRVVPGDAFGLHDEVLTVRPESAEDWAKVVTMVRPNVWVHGWTLGKQAETERNFLKGIGSVHGLVQALVRAKDRPLGDVLGLFVHPMGVVEYRAVAAYAKTLRQEQPALRLSTLALAGEGGWNLDMVKAELAADDLEVRLVSGRRAIRRYVETSLVEPPVGVFKKNGVYLITGGAGGLGLIVAEHLVHTRRARVVLVGRSVLDGERRSRVTGLGAAAIYLQADVSVGPDAESVVKAAKDKFGRLDGVLHAAGGLRDGLIWHKTLADFQAVLAPKLEGAKALHATTKDEPLEVFALFSSTAGLWGNAGQADYAYANACLDAWAHDREVARTLGECEGRTVSINWPLWSDGGMGGVTGEAKSSEAGLDVLDRAMGLELLERVLAGTAPQVCPLRGKRDAVLKRFEVETANLGETVPTGIVVPPLETEVAERIVAPPKAAVIQHLLGLFCELTKLPREQVYADEPIESYGLDSISVTSFAQMLERDLGELSKTLLFEYPTLEKVADFLIEAHAVALAKALSPSSAESHLEVPEPMGTISKGARVEPAVIATTATKNAPSVAEASIAIIGMAGRYPQADNLAEFWENLAAGKDCIESVPEERWDWRDYYDPTPMKPGATTNKWGGFVRGVDEFDPLFFNLSPREAQFMDPQERLFLETVWSTLDDAGCPRSKLQDRKVGVFVGVMYGQYQLFGVEERLKGNPVSLSSSFATIANRVSFFFNWRGPSMAVDTMCSSSLTAIHLACESLRRGESEFAIAGGVNLTIHPEKDLILSQSGFSAKDGRCRAFGEGGEGYVPGEGVGAVLLKPLSKAIADGDRIQGVIRASAMNHGGRTNGYTVPNSRSQAEVVGEALVRSQIDPASITYIEAHGTGTSLGDPIELTGLQQAFEAALADQAGGSRPDPGYCAVGSVKSNIGHAESAAGIAGVTKVLLQFHHGKLVPSLHAETLNPNIQFTDSFFRVQRELSPWPQSQKDSIPEPRRAGVSSFGAGGANAHLILEEYVAPARPVLKPTPIWIVLSAKNETRLREAATNLARFLAIRIDPASNGSAVLRDAQPGYLQDVAWTLQTGREAMEERFAARVSDLDDAIVKLRTWIAGGTFPGLHRGRVKRRANGAAGDALAAATPVDSEDPGALWVTGGEVDWSVLPLPGNPALLALPTYPFARLRCWVPEPESAVASGSSKVGLSIMFFSDSAQVSAQSRYRLVLEAAKYADRHGFDAVWTPERHFHAFGGIYSSPATLMAALAATTKRIRLRAGSVVLPLEDPLRVAEAWSVVDNLSDGRVDLGFASGWNPNDFALAPSVYPKLRDTWLARIPEVQRLWRGETVARRNGKGETVQLRIYPEPRQKELPVWLTVSRRIESFEEAGRGGYNVLTMLQGSTLEELAKKIARYRAARAEAGLDPVGGCVTLMLHTFVDPDEDRAQEIVRKPFLEYIRSSLDAHMHAVERGQRASEADLDKMAEFSYERYRRHASLIGSPENCMGMVRDCHAAGVDEIAALLDFGASSDEVLNALPHLATLRARMVEEFPAENAVPKQELRKSPKSAEVAGPIKGRFLKREWREAPVPQSASAAVTEIVIIGEPAGALEQALVAQHGGDSVQVVSLDAMERACGADGGAFAGADRIYFLAPVSAPGTEDQVNNTAAAQEIGPLALARLVQSLAAQKWWRTGRQLRVLTRGVFAVETGDNVNPQMAGLTGMVASLAKEYPRADLAVIDLSEGWDDTDAVAVAVAREPAQKSGEQIALRSGTRRRLHLATMTSLAESPTRFRSGGVYLIVGGAGWVGQHLSRHLASNYRAKIIWTGRRPIDATIERAMGEIEALGGEAHYMMAAGEDAAAMREVTTAVRARYGALHGAFHAAMVFHDERLSDTTEAELRRILDAKTRGSVALWAAVRDQALDFVLYLGSAQSLFPEACRAGYAAACSFQDAWVVKADALTDFPVQLINWGFWEHGLDPSLLEGLKAGGLGAITAAEGMAAIETVLAAGWTQVAFLKMDDAALTRIGVQDGPPVELATKPEPRSLDDILVEHLFN